MVPEPYCIFVRSRSTYPRVLPSFPARSVIWLSGDWLLSDSASSCLCASRLSCVGGMLDCSYCGQSVRPDGFRNEVCTLSCVTGTERASPFSCLVAGLDDLWWVGHLLVTPPAELPPRSSACLGWDRMEPHLGGSGRTPCSGNF
jgi:hypothetical protein